MRYLLVLVTAVICNSASYSQENSLKGERGRLYFTWGYTKAIYSKSSIHFQNTSNQYNPVTNRFDYYDFTIYDATAHDRPDYKKIRDVVNITVPQFVFRIGGEISDKWGIELNYDHTKYVVDDYQNVKIKGQFNNSWVNEQIVLDPDSFLHFEHTDGANFWMINAVRKWNLYSPNKDLKTSWVLKPGGGVVIPRTETWLFGQKLNNDWKLAGWIVGVETGLRVEFFRNGIFEFVAKGSYANYVNAYVLGRGLGKANHHFFAGQLTATIGYKFNSRN